MRALDLGLGIRTLLREVDHEARFSRSFFALGQLLISASHRKAEFLLRWASFKTSFTGRLARVYAPPLPVLCSARQRARSVVTPI